MSARIYALQIASALVLTITALWAGTQWAAAMLGYQAPLGAPWLELLDVKVYAPWKLFVWWLAFDAQAPDVFVRAGAVAAFGGLASGAVAIGGTARRGQPQETNNNLRLGPLGGPCRRQGSAAARRSGRRARHL
jgi:type IV secretion system protein VirD4